MLATPYKYVCDRFARARQEHSLDTDSGHGVIRAADEGAARIVRLELDIYPVFNGIEDSVDRPRVIEVDAGLGIALELDAAIREPGGGKFAGRNAARRRNALRGEQPHPDRGGQSPRPDTASTSHETQRSNAYRGDPTRSFDYHRHAGAAIE
jgi:hypothetical protein